MPRDIWFRERDMQSERDIALVTGVKRQDACLLANGAMLPELKEMGCQVHTATKGADLTRLVRDGQLYDRIFVGFAEDLGEATLKKLIKLNAGLICFMVNAADPVDLTRYLSNVKPWSESWTWRTNRGTVVATTARGDVDRDWIA